MKPDNIQWKEAVLRIFKLFPPISNSKFVDEHEANEMANIIQNLEQELDAAYARGYSDGSKANNK